MLFRPIVSLVLSIVFVSGLLANANKVLFIAGEPSHGWNKHEFPAGCEVLAGSLNESGLGVEASVSLGWPEEEGAFEGVGTVVVYCDGAELHVANEKVDQLDALYSAGVNFVFLHFAVEPGTEELAAFMTKSIGGYFDLDWSVNPVWTLKNATLSDSTISNGVSSFELEDEWYYHMRFRDDGGYTPVLSAVPPADTIGEDGPRSGNPVLREELAAGKEQHLAWSRVGEKGQRGFGFTGGHFHSNWNDDDFRRLVLNGIAWTAGMEIPDHGVVSDFPSIVKYKTVEESIARGDVADMASHLEIDPSLLNKPGRGNMTLLQQAIMRKKSEAAAFLLGRGADPNALTKSKQTSLHLAVVRNLPEMCRELGNYDVDLSVRDKQGWTALHLAAAKNQAETVRALIEIGCDVNALSDAGGTPLHEAGASGGEDVLKQLLEAGVDPKVVSSHGVTALDLAREYKNEAAILLLKDL
ncbi:ankyrin repeat domain-containing protein [Pelagicoccus mobilis]|uniref:Ankyrin repeat domain-containing protein n=1 Tax=Pelagicoccus mobilis TaxID=415221 RepID=A0A934S220_9BACT|nr:ankyrin repeat domain-containing protein [Pelagicoccus mobilis]MBK1879629.1 ankyrin repeat domain-containing protein [Pelagicoccus mobilis]